MRQQRGRDKFKRFEWLLIIFTACLKLMPVGLVHSLYRHVSYWQGYSGITIRYCVLRVLSKQCGTNVFIGHGVDLVRIDQLSLGNNISIHSHCYLDAGGGITIGDDVAIAHQTSILSFNHSWNDPDKPIKDNPIAFAPIVIEDDVWVGCGCRILAGVTIHRRSIIAAGAVVTCDVPTHTVVGGVPAKVLQQITEEKMSTSQ